MKRFCHARTVSSPCGVFPVRWSCPPASSTHTARAPSPPPPPAVAHPARRGGGVEFFLGLGSAADAAAATLGNNDTFQTHVPQQAEPLKASRARRGGLARASRNHSVGRTCGVGSAENTAANAATAGVIDTFRSKQ